jgi:hypothetical protein
MIPTDAWLELRDPVTTNLYYLNTITGLSQWMAPEWLLVHEIYVNTITAGVYSVHLSVRPWSDAAVWLLRRRR